MINRRKLIQLIISEIHSEKTYFDYKREIDLKSEAGKAKLVKSIAALANSNPLNNSYLIVGIDDETHDVISAKYIDDQNLQQLVRNYLDPQIQISYENVPFPHSLGKSFLGLITISPSASRFEIKKDIWKLKKGEIYARSGSEIIKFDQKSSSELKANDELISLEKRASVKLKYVIDELVKFYQDSSKAYHPQHIIYNDQHVICYSGYKEGLMLSEVWLHHIGEGISLFWTALEYVIIDANPHSFIVTEYKRLFWQGKDFYSPYKRTEISFLDDGKYKIKKENIFSATVVSQEEINLLIHDYKNSLIEISKTNDGDNLDTRSLGRLEIYPYELLIAILNGSTEAKVLFENYLDGQVDGVVAESYRDAKNILNEIK